MKKLVFILLISFIFSALVANPFFSRGGKKFLPILPEKKRTTDNVHFCDTLTEQLAGFCNIIRGIKVFEEIVQDVRNDEIDDAIEKCVNTPYDRRDCEEFVDKLKKYLD